MLLTFMDGLLSFVPKHISFTTYENAPQAAEHIFAQLDAVLEHSFSVSLSQLSQQTF